MKDAESSLTYEQYRDDQIACASIEDLLLILARELVRMKDETGVSLFWDEEEERFMRGFIETADSFVLN